MDIDTVSNILKFGQLGVILAILFGLYKLADRMIREVVVPVAQAWIETVLKTADTLSAILAQSSSILSLMTTLSQDHKEIMSALSQDHKEITSALRDLNGGSGE